MQLTAAEREERIMAMRQMTAHELFTKAAEIIEAEPVMAIDHFTDFALTNKKTGETIVHPDVSALDLKEWTPSACHCLEGALQDAGGVYTEGEHYDEVVPGFRPKLIADYALVKEWDASWQTDLNRVLVRQFPIGAVQDIAEARGWKDGYIDNDALVYDYSDQVLGPMGAEGPKEAARLLRAAAAEVAPRETS